MLTVSKFWTRNRLGDRMRDKYNLNILDTEDDVGEFTAEFWFLFHLVLCLCVSCLVGGCFPGERGVNQVICISCFEYGWFEFGVF